GNMRVEGRRGGSDAHALKVIAFRPLPLGAAQPFYSHWYQRCSALAKARTCERLDFYMTGLVKNEA
ncbi:hypothetical protein O5560_27255, partial [Escherichia coli]|nr:hypothetical protein [Escherichia coli]